MSDSQRHAVAGLQSHLQQRLSLTTGAQASPSSFCIAFSGGLDSTVLVHAMATLQHAIAGIRVRAVHIDHGLQADSAAWSERCETVCSELGLPCLTLRVDVDPAQGAGPEACARAARYAALAAELQPDEVLLLAQHQDDQLETVLLQLMRGGGVHGLSAMPADAPFAAGRLCRPFLEVSREALQCYAAAAGLTWVEDPSNSNAAFDRNFLRHQVLPHLIERWPAAAASAARSARYAAEAAELGDILAAIDAEGIHHSGSVSIAGLQALPLIRQRNLLRFVIRDLGLTVPPETRLQEIWNSVLCAAVDARPVLFWPGGFAARYRERLYLLPPVAAEPPAVLRVPLERDMLEQPHGIKLGGAAGVLRLQLSSGSGLALSRLQFPLEIRFREGGERLQPAGTTMHRTLKNLFQEAGVLPWMRASVPLLYSDNELLAIGDHWYAADFVAGDSEPGVELVWEHSSPWRAAAS